MFSASLPFVGYVMPTSSSLLLSLVFSSDEAALGFVNGQFTTVHEAPRGHELLF